MKIWKQHIAWPRLALNVLLFAFISSSCAAPTLTMQAIMPANSITTVQATGNYITRVFTDAQGMQMTYYLFIPINYDPQIKYPLVLLLHGGNERASVGNPVDQNRDALLNQNYVRIWGPGIPAPTGPNVQAQYPSFIVVPQADYPRRWVDVPANQGSYTLAAQPTDSLRMAKEIVDALQEQYPNIDPHRLYVTGISMGGYGTWEAIERWPDYFAAAAPLAGAGDPSKASRLVNLPIWAFHGSGDGDAPVSGSRNMIQAIMLAGGHPRYTEYPSAGHDIWMMVYSTPDFISWLFSQRTSHPQPGSVHCSDQPTTWSLPSMLETWLHAVLGLKARRAAMSGSDLRWAIMESISSPSVGKNCAAPPLLLAPSYQNTGRAKSKAAQRYLQMVHPQVNCRSLPLKGLHLLPYQDSAKFIPWEASMLVHSVCS